MFADGKKSEIVQCENGVTRKNLGIGGQLMLCEVSFRKGARGNAHSHPNEQVSYISRGSFRFKLGDEERVLKEGDSVYIAPGVVHSATALEDSIIVDCFTPIRQDFLK